MNEIDLFIPGRLCLFGEHSDWASEIDENITGCSIVASIDQGIYAKAKKNNIFSFTYEKAKLSIEMELEKIKSYFKDPFFKYVAASVYIMMSNYNVDGIDVNITKLDLPIKKGLSSSAAISLVIIRAFSKIYDLNLSYEQEMNLAYKSEILIGSMCGKMDQICAYGSNMVKVIYYNNGNTDIQNIDIKGEFHFLIVDLNFTKNTTAILSDLHIGYMEDEKIKEYFGKTSLDICYQAIKCLNTGNAKEFGKLMTKAQESFDNSCSMCSKELQAPLLHKILNDDNVKDKIYGGKGVGSQGDGSVQLLVKSEDMVNELAEYLKREYNMNSYKFSLREKYSIKKAIIPAAGIGSRMYPMTKIINKEFLPMLDKDGILKPAICILIEELYNAGIENIVLLIGKEDLKLYESYFFNSYNNDYNKSMEASIIYNENKLNRISSKLRFVIVEKGIGFAKTIALCKDEVKDEPFLLALADQIYTSNIDISCTEQVIKFYENTGENIVSCCEVDIEHAPLYGVLKGEVVDNHFKIDIFEEKPSIDRAKGELLVNIGGENKILAVFGEYILTKDIFEKIEKVESESITESINLLAKEKIINGLIINGSFLDIGNIRDYCKNFNKLCENNKIR